MAQIYAYLRIPARVFAIIFTLNKAVRIGVGLIGVVILFIVKISLQIYGINF